MLCMNILILCEAGLCSDSESDLENHKERNANSDWGRVLDQPTGIKMHLKINRMHSSGKKDSLVVKGKMISADETSIALMTPPGSTRRFDRDQILAVRVRRPVLKRISGYIAAGAALIGIYVLIEAVRGQSLDLVPRGHAMLNLGITAPATAAGFFLGNRTRTIYRRDSSK